MSQIFRQFRQLKPWLGSLLLLIIAFICTTSVSILNIEGTNATIIISVFLGTIFEYSLDRETLLLNVLLASMVTLIGVSLLTISLSTILFEFIVILAGLAILTVTTTIVMQWLVRNWICPFYGFTRGILISAIAICLGITGSNLIFD